MAKIEKRFKKGQVVFYAEANVSSIAEGERNGRFLIVRAGAVITRTIDSCGVKQMTFEDHGNDSTFGKSQYSNNPFFFDNAEDAFECLRKWEHTEVIAKKVYSDKTREWYDDLVEGRMAFISEQK